MKKYATTGDGILTAIMIAEEMCDSKASLAKLAEPIKLYPQYLKNVRVKDKTAAVEDIGVKESVEKFSKLISANGELESIDEWGKRTLAYEINDEAEGFYVLYNFNCAPSFPYELERKLRIDESILRYLVVTRV